MEIRIDDRLANEAEHRAHTQLAEHLEQIIQRLNRARQHAGLTQTQAAKLLGFNGTASSLSPYERGDTPLTMMLFLRMCDVYDVSPTWALTGVNPEFDADAFLSKIEDMRLATEDVFSLIETMEMLRQENE